MLIKRGNYLSKKHGVAYFRKCHLIWCFAYSINRQRQAEGKSDTEEDEDSGDVSSSMSEEVDGDVEGKTLWIGVGIIC